MARCFGWVFCPILALLSGGSLFGQDYLLLEGTELSGTVGLRSLVVVGDRIFMLDPDGRLLTFDGDRARQVIGKGQGPGELNRPIDITLQGERIFISDTRKIHEYDTLATYLRSHTMPSGLSFVGRAKAGFLYMSGLGFGQLSQQMKLLLLHDSGERTIVSEWEPEIERNPRAKRTMDTLRFALERSFSWISRDSAYAYTQVSGLDEVHITEVDSGHVKTIRVTGQQRPYPEEYHQKFLDDYNRKHGRKLKADYPDFYPLIQHIAVSRENHLIIVKSGKELPLREESFFNPENYLVFDHLGNPLEPNIFDLHFWRIAWLDPNWVYVTLYNPELDEHSVAKTARSKFEEVAAKYPVSFRYSD